MIDKISSVCAELMKNERESLVSIWGAYFPGEGNQGEEKQGTGNKVAASKSLLV
ncbi:conserved hypothetical protein [Vibrio crassostreae]|uniref:hypothetical protein n=1 Tax=Vibrio crassostreae TaxID=246167 RepID=UPI000F99A199|nr:hypothetical protein [Vibrio crassostreae]ROR14160.1 hypothetical protein EDB36_107160 [Vibrio crassostreae]ROR25483.1 hypothetical protein EDB67_104136 [Vibrio crassostreae]CAK2140795.1 conserved hypothetical protein [Vibrio crassostreae]CAK2355466.1 conserved hypothetical protein [Vibrio crassostreae]CAK2370344.1 conserved hypothetical protein [Vibrio crassostreae]